MGASARRGSRSVVRARAGLTGKDCNLEFSIRSSCRDVEH